MGALSVLGAVEMFALHIRCWLRFVEYNTKYTEKSHGVHRGLGARE
jgi:hypothetical protein